MGWVHVESSEAYSVVGVMLAVFIFISAVSVVYVANKSRKLFSDYYQLQLSAQELQDERARLLLQESSESTTAKILHQATTTLHMHVPPVDQRLYLP